MAIGTIAGAEAGAQLIQILKRAGNVNVVVSIVSIVVYLGISIFMIWESAKNVESRQAKRRIRARADHSCDSPFRRAFSA